MIDPLLTVLLLSLVLLSTGGLCGVLVERFVASRRRAYWKGRNQWRWNGNPKRTGWVTPREVSSPWAPTPSSQPKTTDAADQLRIVMAADFLPQPLLNKKEARVFRELDQYVLARNPDWQVMAQVSLGEILRCENAEAYGCINAKRVDLLLVDEECQPRHAVEYQGSGHYLSDAAARDAVKREALRRAGIGYHEVLAGHTTPADLKRLVEKLVDGPAALPAVPSEGAD